MIFDHPLRRPILEHITDIDVDIAGNHVLQALFFISWISDKLMWSFVRVKSENDLMKIERFGNKFILEGLPIADINNPKLPYYYFDQIIRKIGYMNITKDLLFKIFKLNIEIRKKIIDESNFIDNEVSNMLIKLLNYEINLISSHN